MQTMTRRTSTVALLALFVALSACIPKTIQTPQGKAAYTAVQVLNRVEELQNTAIKGNQQGIVSDKTAILVVQFTVSAAKTLKATPDGWQATVRKAWAEAKAKIPAPDTTALGASIAAIDLVLSSLVGG